MHANGSREWRAKPFLAKVAVVIVIAAVVLTVAGHGVVALTLGMVVVAFVLALLGFVLVMASTFPAVITGLSPWQALLLFLVGVLCIFGAVALVVTANIIAI